MPTMRSVALFVLLASRVGLGSDGPAAPEEGFVPLFDGTSMAGWRPHNGVPQAHVGGKWGVRDGLLIGDQSEGHKGGFLITEGKYRDFDLRLEVKMDYPTDSGIFLRMGEDGKSHQLTLDHRPLGEIGSIYLPWTQSRVLKNPKGIEAFKPDDWNVLEVRMEGEPARIRFWVNGTLITDFQHTAETTMNVPAEGYIGLQVHPNVPNLTVWKDGNLIRYRNIRIKPLAPAGKAS
jgi:hypothetical protein